MNAGQRKAGPLDGVRIVELAGIGPLPYAGMLLGDMGADVLRIDRSGGGGWPDPAIVYRNRTALTLDLKNPDDLALLKTIIGQADVLLEAYRPGVMERLGLGPDALTDTNPRLIYGRMTGWGQTGPLAQTAGHDINYLAIAGALSTLGAEGEPPVPPHNLLGDYAGGAMFLVFGIVAALYEREKSGKGQIVDAAIVDGAASMMAPLMGMAAAGLIDLDRHRNMLGGHAAPYYRSYRCSDGRFIAVGPLEAKFRALFADGIGVEADLFTPDDPQSWPEQSHQLETVIATRTRDEWVAVFAGTDACVAPVLEIAESAAHPHMRERETYIEHDGLLQPQVAPRLSVTPGSIRSPAPQDDTGARETLRRWNVAIA